MKIASIANQEKFESLASEFKEAERLHNEEFDASGCEKDFSQNRLRLDEIHWMLDDARKGNGVTNSQIRDFKNACQSFSLDSAAVSFN